VTGTISHVRDGTLSMKSEVLGDLSIPMDKVATFSTDAAIEIHLTEGAVVTGAVEPGGDGEIRTAERPEPIALATVSAVNPGWGRWSGSASAGALVTRGNSQTESFNATIDAVRRTARDRLTLGASYLYARQKDENGVAETTTDAWRLRGQYDYFLGKRL
jgi:hypothetical protein